MEPQHGRRFSIGLTGGIGSGKSTVADLFAALGASVIDTDQIARSLTAPHGAAMPALLAEFGDEFATPDGALDRALMRNLVFADPGARARLEAILHPKIRDATAAAAAIATGAYVIFDVPLLVESGNWAERVDRVLVVDCPESLQLQRVMARSNLQESQVRAIMAAQATREQRLAAADDVILNDDGLDLLAAEVEQFHAFYIKNAARMSTIGP
jgi:dephospho-CoA kinase